MIKSPGKKYLSSLNRLNIREREEERADPDVGARCAVLDTGCDSADGERHRLCHARGFTQRHANVIAAVGNRMAVVILAVPRPTILSLSGLNRRRLDNISRWRCDRDVCGRGHRCRELNRTGPVLNVDLTRCNMHRFAD